MSAIGG
jgi:hypothetical protein